MFADELVKMLKIQSNAAGGSAAIRTAFADFRAKVEDAAERFPKEQDLDVVLDFVCVGQALCRPSSPASWKPFVIMALHGLKSECQEHIDAADCAMRRMRDSGGAFMRAASAARARREFRHAMEAQGAEASLSPPGNESPLRSHGPKSWTEQAQAAKDELHTNQEHHLSRATKKRRL